MNGVLDKILKYVQDRQTCMQKPASLPITSLAQMDAFENMSEDEYSDIVSKKKNVGSVSRKMLNYFFLFFL